MQITKEQTRVLFISVFVIAICGLIYELIVGALSSYLLGNSITHFSITIGLFMTAMGIGSYLSRWVKGEVLTAFIAVELVIGLVGGTSAVLLYAIFATTKYFYLAMGLLILVVGGCIGLEIPLLTRLVGQQQNLKDTLANVLAFDYIGALLGSILFPLILLPEFGLMKTSFAVGLLNQGVVAINIWTFRHKLTHLPQLTGLTFVVTAVLLGGTLWANNLVSFFEQRLYRDQIIYADQTPYQKIVITRWRDDVRLFLDGNLQFSSSDEYRYHELLVHPAMDFSRSRESILILGGGDGLVSRELFKYPDVQRVVLVDIDPAMTDLARTHPTILAINQDALSDPRIELVHQDAYKYLEETSEKFGVIILDLPDPNNESLSKLYSREFYTLLQQHLGKGGVIASQATSPYFVHKAYWCIVHTAESVGWQVQPYRTYIPSFGDWGFFLATEQPVDVTKFSPDVPLRYLSQELLENSFFFDPDIAEVETDINTLNSPALLRYYEEGWHQWR